MGETSLREYCEQIETMIEQGHFSEAVAHGKHILKQYPRHIDTYRLLGKTMLETGQDEYAVDMFHRVLSADPEDLVAWVGLSEVHNKHDALDAAIWHLERAFELASDNKAIGEELRQLYGRRDGAELEKTPLTAGALARLYLKGDLLSRAINDLRALLAEHPERVDLRVALAEALWRNDQRLETSQVCQQVLDELPYCLKANLILGNIWISSGREEGQTYLQRAEALDPENKMAQELFGEASPLPARQAQIVPLDYRPSTGEERPAWMLEVDTASEAGAPLTEKEAALVGITAALEAQIEIPSWLEDIGADTTVPVSEPPDLAALPQAQPSKEATLAPAEKVPDWLTTDLPEEPVGEQAEAIAEIEEETPEWLTELGLEPISEEEKEGEPPDWLAELGVDAAEESPPVPSEAREDETPDWLTAVSGDEAMPAAATVEQSPDWLSGLREQFTGEATVPEETIPSAGEIPLAPALGAAEPIAAMPAPAPAEIPDWLQELAPTEAVAPIEAAPEAESEIAPTAEAAAPAWLEGEQTPSGDEALAWLEQLAEGKEEELQAQIQADADIRMAEIMGRPAPKEPPAEIAPEEPPIETPAPAEVPDWIQELAPTEEAVPIEAAPEAAPEIAPAAEAVAPAWLEGDQTPSGDEALAWLEQLAEGKEEELQAQIQADADIRMAEIMGRSAPKEPPAEIAPEEPPIETPAPAEVPDWIQELAPTEEAVPIEAAPEEPPATPSEEPFGWTAFGEPEAGDEIAPAAEAAAPTWLEGEQTPSGDEALAWLEQLAEGKEEELQAQIQADAEIRMAEIMGRPAPKEPPAEIAPEEPPIETPAPAEVPDWIQELAPTEDAAPIEAAPEEPPAPPSEEPFGWTAFGEPEARTESIPVPPVEETPPVTVLPPEEPPVETLAPAEIPDWIQELAPTEEAAPIEAAPEEPPAPPAEEPFGWTAFGEPEARTESIPVPPVEEIPPVTVLPPEEIAPPQVVKIEVEVEVVAQPPEKAAAPPEEIAPPLVIEQAAEVIEVVPQPPEEIAVPPESPIVEPPAGPLAAERAYLKENPRDYDAWLALARALWQADEREESLAAYSRVIRSGKLTKDTISDLEEYLERWPDVHVQQVLGDAYMKDGQLQEALDLYRKALETL